MTSIGIVGTGRMARQHVNNFHAIPDCRVTACADIVAGRAEAFAKEHGIAAAYQDVEAMLASEALDGVAVVTVDSAHAAVTLAAISRQLPVLCEKPLADSLAKAEEMFQAAERAGIVTAVNFSWRNRAAVQMAASLVADGRLGELRHVEGQYLQSWLTLDWQTEPSLLWRLSTRHGSAGVLGDIGVHMLDLISLAAGETEAVACDLTVFDKGVKQVGEYLLDANDSMSAMLRLSNGARGTLNVTRWARGRGNTVRLQVYGTRGALDLDLDRPADEQLQVYLDDDSEATTWTALECPPVPTQQQRFVEAIRTGRQPQAKFADGLQAQMALDACFRSAANGSAWTTVASP